MKGEIDALLVVYTWLNAHEIYVYIGAGVIGVLFVIEVIWLLKTRPTRHRSTRSTATFDDMPIYDIPIDDMPVKVSDGDLDLCLIEDEEYGTVRASVNFGDYVPSVLMEGTREPVRRWNYYGDMVYYLKCRKQRHTDPIAPDRVAFLDNFLTPIEPPLELGEMPDSLWRALHRAYDFIPIEFEVPPPEWLMGMMKYAVIALVIGAFIFIVAKGKT